MAGFRHNPETGEREFTEADAPAEQQPSSPPMQQSGWVEDFLRGSNEPLPFRVTDRPSVPRQRSYKRKSWRR